MANNPYNLPSAGSFSLAEFSITGWYFEFRRNGSNVWVRASRTSNLAGYAFCGFTFQRVTPQPLSIGGSFGLDGPNVFYPGSGSQFCTAYIPGVRGQSNTLKFTAGINSTIRGEKFVFPYIN